MIDTRNEVPTPGPRVCDPQGLRPGTESLDDPSRWRCRACWLTEPRSEEGTGARVCAFEGRERAKWFAHADSPSAQHQDQYRALFTDAQRIAILRQSIVGYGYNPLVAQNERKSLKKMMIQPKTPISLANPMGKRRQALHLRWLLLFSIQPKCSLIYLHERGLHPFVGAPRRLAQPLQMLITDLK